MAKSENTARPSWASFLDLDTETLTRLRHAGGASTSLVPVGQAWDTVGNGWEAVVIAPLARGLAALAALDLPHDEGYPVIADHARSELIVLVPSGTASRALGNDVQGMRALTAGSSYLLAPCGQWGSYTAAWLSRPTRAGGARYVDPARLREAVLTAEAERTEHAHAC